MSDITTVTPIEEPRNTRKRRILLASLGVLAVAAIAATVLLVQRPASSGTKKDTVAVQTATVTRGDLTEQIRTQGKLGFASPRDIGTQLQGTVTGLPPVGSAALAGGELFRIDNAPVILMHGDLPVWRSFESGMSDGADVAQLERNLATPGFFGFDADERFNWDTQRAIMKWQKSLGLEQTGSIELGRIVFAPGDVRVQASKAAVGDAASTAIISVTGGAKVVEVFIDPAQQPLAPVGAQVKITLPGGAETTGTVSNVGAPVEREGANGKAVKVPLTLTLDDPAASEGLDNITVTVLLTQVKGSDLLLVPVVALLAQPDGGFAVEVQLKKPAKDGATTKLVPIELGAFADGQVAVTGGKLHAGDTVVVAK